VPTTGLSNSPRRLLGQFWTPEPLADFLVSLITPASDKYFLDPALGTGIFVAKYLENLHRIGGTINTDQIYGTEIDPKIYDIFQKLGPGSRFSFPNVKNFDYLTTNIEQKFDIIIGNPPYTRHHDIDPIYKIDVRQKLQSNLNIKISSFSSLFVYFFLKSLSELSPTGRLIYVTPIELFEAAYAKPVIQLVSELFNLRAIIRFGPHLQIFPDTDNNLCITIVDGKKTIGNETFQVVEIDSLAALKKLNASSPVDSATTGFYQIREQSLENLASLDKSHFRLMVNPTKTGWVPLSNFARLTRGIATGNNDFFLFSDQKIAQTKIPKRYFQPVITRTKETHGLALTKKDVASQKTPWLLYLQQETKLSNDNLQLYLETGEKEGVSEGYLVKTRRRWYHMERRVPAPIIFTYLGRTNPRFIRNEAKAQALSTFLLLYPKFDLTKINLKAFLAILNSPEFIEELKSHSRTYGSGGIKIEPRELEKCLVPDFSKITAAEKKKLAQSFK
jgi:hypothetical protein